MHDSYAWSLSLGRWGGIQVRLHALFLLFGVITIFLGTRSSDSDLVLYGAMSLGILFFSVLLHEFGHCYAAFRCGGHAEEIVLVPWGGMTQASVPREPQSELLTASAGPLVNLLIVLLTIPLLVFVGDVNLLGLLNPLRPEFAVDPAKAPIVFLKLTFWLNWVLVLANLLPAFPFDGGRMLRAILWPWLGYRPAIVAVARVARLMAVLICVFAWLTHDPTVGTMIVPWFPLVLLALFLLFSAQQELVRLDHQDYDEDLFGYDFSQGYTSLERPAEPPSSDRPGPMRRWLEKRRVEKEQQRRKQEAAEERRIDEILARLHGQGMKGLSAEDRALLHRVSARYRNRQKH